MNTIAAAGHTFLSLVSDDYAAMRQSKTQSFPNKGRLLIDFESASLVGLGYVAIVIFGFIKRASAPPAAVSPKVASPKGGDKDDKPKGTLHYFKCIYNLTQVALCGWLMFHAARIHLQTYGVSKLWCLPFNFNPASAAPASAMNPDLAYIVWVFYLSKVLDFFDTIFIIASNNWAQFSFLHYYHHLTIYLVYWMNANIAADGDVYLTVVLNCFVHCVMYFYYFVTATDFGGLKKVFFKYKLVVTSIQMIQFVCMITQGVSMLLYPVDCRYPRRVICIYVPYIISLFILFGNFMLKTKGKREPASPKAESKKD
jgi:elongation of very long chain fatty acids protein 4